MIAKRDFTAKLYAFMQFFPPRCCFFLHFYLLICSCCCWRCCLPVFMQISALLHCTDWLKSAPASFTAAPHCAPLPGYLLADSHLFGCSACGRLGVCPIAPYVFLLSAWLLLPFYLFVLRHSAFYCPLLLLPLALLCLLFSALLLAVTPSHVCA